jgi:plasmid stabilization system protein ParE
MAKRKIVWTNTASHQLRSILEFWVENNKNNSYSQKLLDKIEKVLNQILIHPEIGPESTYPEIRVAAMNHYSIFYKISRNEIIVTALWDNRQDPKRLIEIFRNA